MDLMSLSAHKIGGPQGVGALVVADGLVKDPRSEAEDRKGPQGQDREHSRNRGFRAAAEWLLGGGADIDMVTELRECFEAV